MAIANIKFSTKINADFIKELRAEVKSYFDQNNISKYSNYHIYLKTLLMFGFYIGSLVIMLTGVVSNIWLILGFWFLMGIGKAGLGMVVMHDANHKSLSNNQNWNLFMANIMYLLGGSPEVWRQQHNTNHHGFTNIDGVDEDIAPPSKILRFSPHKPLYKIHRFQQWYAWFFYGLMTISWITNKDFVQLKTYKRDQVKLQTNKSYSRLFFYLLASKVLYYVIFLILPLILIPAPWYIIVIGFFIMHFVAGLSLGAIFQTAHVMPSVIYPQPDEEGNIENNWAVHQMMTTSDYAPKSRVFSWFIGGLNYQVEHHLFPNISHVHYRDLSEIVKRTAAKYNVPYLVEDSFFSAVVSHYKMLKVLGR